MKVLRHERLLARTFFLQFFESDQMPPGLPQVQLVIWGVAVFAAPPYLLSFVLAIRYQGVHANASLLAASIRTHQMLFVTFAMMALGLVALIIWEEVFPDRRDARILGVLPLRTRTHVLARISALGAVAVLFCLGMNLPPAILYGLALWGNGAAAGPLRGIAAHLLATGLGGLFVFFVVIACQGTLLNLFGRRTARMLALALQSAFIILLLQAMLFAPQMAVLVRAAFRDGSLVASLLPPAWFLALYGSVAGPAATIPLTYSLSAGAATLLAVFAAMILLAFTYERLLRMALETQEDRRQRGTGIVERVSGGLERLCTKRPVERAVTVFTLQTISRSRHHLVLLATYVGFAAAIAMASLISLFSKDGAGMLNAPTTTVLSVPLVFNFVVLCGVRVLVAIPTEIQANWAFRLHAREDQIFAASRGVRVALMLAIVAPIALVTAFMGAVLWGTRTGVILGLFTGSAGMVLLDILLVAFRKIPFTCTYYPGRSRARTLGPLYLLAFSMYAYALARLELVLLDRPLLVTGLFLALVAAADMALAYLRHRVLQPPPGFTYEEQDPDAVFGGFRLSEGLAAETHRIRSSQ